MVDKTGQQLSELVDDECAASEAELLLRRLARDPELQGRWQRYHLIGEALKNNLPDAIDRGFAAQVRAAIASDPPLPGAAARSIAVWYKPLAGFAVAASVAGVALLGLSLLQPEPGADGRLLLSANDPPPDRPRETVPTAADARLNSYLVNHSEYATLNSVHGVLPYVRIVGYEGRR
ncbi:MAG: sigma-E factor negative regulatory protein [Pseudomonadota bacterium]|nr:sigma-E factor negative regulatory protein [Pseudomonadota bacterium]